MKLKQLTSLVAIFCITLFCNFNTKTLAIENIDKTTVYPDYSYEFTGKDPCEKFNRKLFVFNLKVNKYIVRPVNIVWASVMPKYGMDRIQNVYNHVNYPVRLMGCVFQKDFKAAKQETKRFFINTTVGFAGLYDPAKTKFKLEPRLEDIPQALAHTKIKQGPYLVLPCVQGNLRDLAGKLLNCPLRPNSYVGPFGAVATALFTINNTTYTQPMVKKVDDTFADPYELAKQVDGIDRYIKNNNLDRKEILEEKIKEQNIYNVNVIETGEVKPDIKLDGFKSQGSLVDSMRTSFFDNQSMGESIWSEMSVWNRNFNKKIEMNSVKLNEKRPNYKYRYVLQKNKSAPLAILYPSIGDGIYSDKSTALAKTLYEQGFSVLIQGSAFNWEFVKSMPCGYKPGLPNEDAKYLRKATAKILEDLSKEKKIAPSHKVLIGCSFGALTGIITAAQENDENTLGISNYIAISPPVEILFALKQLDKYVQDWKLDPDGVQLKTAITAEKIIKVTNEISQKDLSKMPTQIPFTDEEAKLVIAFFMRQKLYDTVFAIENCKRCKKTDLTYEVNHMKYYDYAKKYLFVDEKKTDDDYAYETGLYPIASYLSSNKNYKIYHTPDDYYTNPSQLNWLKGVCKDNLVIFSNGSHLGFMYREEFLTELKKDLTTTQTTIADKIKMSSTDQ